MKLPILKCQGSGNDFILINEYEELLFSDEERVKLSKSFCDRKGRLGADGILFFQHSENADGKMRMFNPDGSEAEMCGNGLRCVGRFASEQFGKDSVFIKTLKGISHVVKDNNIYPDIETYQAQLTTISLHSQDIPVIFHSQSLIAQPLPILSAKLKFTAVSMPNPHLVAMVDDINDSELNKIGEIANQATEIFPKGINVNFCQVLNDNAIYVRTYERGVGLTNSCGSGMSASTLVACLLEHYPFGTKIDVYNRGGLVRCQSTQSEHHQYAVFLSGNVTFLFCNTIEFEFSNIGSFMAYSDKIFVEEIQNYGKLLERTENSLNRSS